MASPFGFPLPATGCYSTETLLPIEFFFEENLGLGQSLARDRHFLNGFHRAGREPSAILRAFTTPGEPVSTGRFHPTVAPEARSRLWRRLSGGRTVPFGDGFLGFSLLLPHRSALVSDDPFYLSPYQVPNRYARGVLTALRALGIDAFYPGRDFVTVRRRTVAMLTFETDEHGGLLFEGVIALDRGFDVLGARLKGLAGSHEPDGKLDPVTSLAGEGVPTTAPREIAEALRAGFMRQFGVESRDRELSSLERQAVDAIAAREFGGDWLGSADPVPMLDRVGATRVPLGTLEIRFALEQERFLREVRMYGDFIANPSAVASLERELRLCPADWRSIALVSDEVFNRPGNFILGIGKLRTIPDTIMKGLPV